MIWECPVTNKYNFQAYDFLWQCIDNVFQDMKAFVLSSFKIISKIVQVIKIRYFILNPFKNFQVLPLISIVLCLLLCITAMTASLGPASPWVHSWGILLFITPLVFPFIKILFELISSEISNKLYLEKSNAWILKPHVRKVFLISRCLYLTLQSLLCILFS